jgi:hypothetical protein
MRVALRPACRASRHETRTENLVAAVGLTLFAWFVQRAGVSEIARAFESRLDRAGGLLPFVSFTCSIRWAGASLSAKEGCRVLVSALCFAFAGRANQLTWSSSATSAVRP